MTQPLIDLQEVEFSIGQLTMARSTGETVDGLLVIPKVERNFMV